MCELFVLCWCCSAELKYVLMQEEGEEDDDAEDGEAEKSTDGEIDVSVLQLSLFFTCF